MNKVTFVFCSLASLFFASDCANILYVVPFTSKSHNIMLKPIGLELARRGHNVTVITGHLHTDPPPNYHQIKVANIEIWDAMGIKRPNVFETLNWSDEDLHNILLWSGGLSFTEHVLKSDKMQDFFKQDNKFDLVIVEQFYQEAFYVLAHKYKAPLILITTFGTCMRHNIMTNHPLQLATIKNEFVTIGESFWGRFRNFYFSMYEYFWYTQMYLRKHEQLVTKYVPGLSKPVPTLYDIQRNFSVMLINRHYSYDRSIALLPNLVEVGGLHLEENNATLPNDLQTVLDNSNKGVIYMSLGSNVKSSEMPKEKVNAFLNVFRKLNNYKIIWKWEDNTLDYKSDNLVVRKWLPQREILRHPQVKAFISHGGLIGTQEAIYNGIPIIGIPIYCDQYNNVMRSQRAGIGRILEYKDITEENLENVLKEVLLNESYMRNAREASYRFKDRPLSPLNTSMYWIEYVIRHRGAEFLKNPGLELSWISLNLLDVYAFSAMTISCLVFSIYYVVFKMILAYKKTVNIKYKIK